LAVVSAEIPSPQSASGFAPRLYQFLSAAQERMAVTLALVHTAAPGEADGAAASVSVDQVRVFSPPSSAWRERGLRGRLLRTLIQYPFDPLPYQCYPRRVPALREFLHTERPDVVAFYLPYMSHLIDHCPADIPVIAVLEEPWEWVVAASLGSSRKDRWLARRETTRFSALYRRIDARVAAVVAISEAERSYFGGMMTSGKITVIPHGIDTRYFRADQVQDRDIDVLVVGKLRASHNLVGALRAWEAARAVPECAHWKWAFVGEIDAHVAQRLRTGGCLVSGAVADVRPFYERARCVLVPALDGRGVKTTSLQAWAMGRPLVASPVGAQGLPASPGDNILVGADPAAMVRQLRLLLDDPVLAQHLADRGRETVERLRDSSVLAESFAALCLEVAAGSSAHGLPSRR